MLVPLVGVVLGAPDVVTKVGIAIPVTRAGVVTSRMVCVKML